MKFASFIILLAALLVSGCKETRKQTNDAMELKLHTDASPSKETAELGDVEIDNSGYLKSRIIISLDYFPTSSPSRASLPRCYSNLKSNVIIGRLTCVEGEMTQEFSTKHVDQECYTETPRLRAEASEKLKMLGCTRARVETYSMKPSVKIDLEVKL